MERVDYSLIEKKAHVALRDVKKTVRMLVHYFNNAGKLEWRTHKSIDVKSNYEDLEFVGDALINWLAARFLFTRGVKIEGMSSEGSLTFIRRRLVDEKALAYFAKVVGLDKYILINDANSKTLSVLSDVAEAFAAQVWFEFGEKKVEEIFTAYWSVVLEFVNENTVIDPKTRLNKYIQKNHLNIEYVYTTKEKEHVCLIKVGGIPIAYGKDYVKKEAAQKAAFEVGKILGI